MKMLNMTLKFVCCMHLLISLNAFSVVLGAAPLEDIAIRADFIGVINVTNIVISETPGCGILATATDVFSSSEMVIHVSNPSDVKSVGRYFAILRHADKSRFHTDNGCPEKNRQSYLAAAGLQTIFPFGNGVTFEEDIILFHRGSIFSSSRRIPEKDFIKGFTVLSDDIVGEVDFDAVVRHLCSGDVSNESFKGLNAFCRQREIKAL